MARAYFVSDIHITGPDTLRATRFVEFLRSHSSASGMTHLFLVGDIFDLWVGGHEYFVTRYRDIVDEIRRLQDDGIEVGYFEGNHDLHLRYFWYDRLGVQVFGDAQYFDIAGRTIRVEHGDQMDPDDRGYLFLRWFLRTPVIRTLIRLMPGNIVAHIGDRASATSRNYTSQVKTIETDVAVQKIRAHARKAWAERPFDLIISGHVHVRDDWHCEDGDAAFRSVNLGSWLDTPCFFLLDEAGGRFGELTGEESVRQAPRAIDELTETG